VDGAELLTALSETFTRYLALPDGAADAMALWTIHTYALDVAFVSPILALTSPEKRCGKTTALEILASLVSRPLPASNLTPAAAFRIIEQCQPTLLVDEADTFLRKNDELRGVLNAGHTRATANVIRTVGEDYEPRQFSTWSPKCVALIGRLPATLEDRSILVSLRRRAPNEHLERLRRDRIGLDLGPLRQKAVRWVRDSTAALHTAEPVVSGMLNDRAADNWRPLLTIAEVAGGDWPARGGRAAQTLAGLVDEAETAPGIELLADLRELFKQLETDRLPSATIVEVLAQREDRPWSEWYGRPITVRGLALLLARFKVRPKVIRVGDETPRGYLHSDLLDAFSRYLPPRPQQAQQASDTAENGASTIRNTPPLVADAGTSENSRPADDVADVAVPSPPSGQGPAL
jgi:putative DNA primase/helicase